MDFNFFNDPPGQMKTKPSLTPIFLSAAIFPGIGQFQQKRTVAGVVYLASSAIAFLIATTVLAKHLPTIIHLIWQAPDSANIREELKPILRALAFFFALYLANVYDVWFAWYRQSLSWKRKTDPGS